MTFYSSGNAAGGREMIVEALRWMTVYEGSNAATPRNRLQRVVKRNGDLLSNSGALMATSVLTSLLGFVYWWVAARSFSADAVGAVSAAVSAMTLIGTLGMFGMGTLLISELPKARSGQWSLISTCVTVAAAVSAVGGLLYVGVALVIPGLHSSLGSPLGVALLLVAISLNAATLVLDEGLVGLLAGHLQLLRNGYFAVGKLVFIAVLAGLGVAANGSELLATWVGGMLVSVALLSLSLRRRGAGPIRPDFSVLRGLRRHAMDHNLLNVSLFLPRICLPLVVTSVVSTRATAGFYTAWMIMAFLAMIPGSIATTLFAVASGDAAALRAKVRIGLAIALGMGVPLSLGVAVLARPVMSLFGPGYVETGGVALSILALTYAAGVMRQFYVAISRVHQRVRRASGYAVIVGVAELGAAWAGGRHGGLHGLVTWFAVTVVAEGLFFATTVLRVALGAGLSAPPRHARTREHRPTPPAPIWPASPWPAPRQPAGPGGGDETMVMPRQAVDETAVFERPPVDETAVLLLHDLRSTATDETVVMPRIPAQRATTDRPDSTPASHGGDR
jgi:O-antigen/teichoic acid export membrane protein